MTEVYTTLLLVDQFAHTALTVADHAYVFAAGRTSIESEARVLLAMPEIAREYLGQAWGAVTAQPLCATMHAALLH